MVDRSFMVRWVVGSIPQWTISRSSWYNEGRGISYPLHGMVHINCGFPLSLCVCVCVCVCVRSLCVCVCVCVCVRLHMTVNKMFERVVQKTTTTTTTKTKQKQNNTNKQTKQNKHFFPALNITCLLLFFFLSYFLYLKTEPLFYRTYFSFIQEIKKRNQSVYHLTRALHPLKVQA